MIKNGGHGISILVLFALTLAWMLVSTTFPLMASAADSTILLPDPSCMMSHINSSFCLQIAVTIPHQEFLRNCAWSIAGDSLRVFWVWESRDAYDTSTEDESLFQQQTCVHDDWTAFRIGPFSTSGGFSWTGVAAFINSSHVRSYRSDVFAFSHYSMGNLDMAHALVGYPPIHQHHFHIFGSSKLQVQTMNNHGDNQCDALSGGVLCLHRTAPAGYAWMVAPRLGFVTEFNDVRSEDAPTLQSWAFVAFKVVPSDVVVRQIRMVTSTFMPSRQPQYLYKGSRWATWQVDTHLVYVGWSHASLPGDMSEIIESYIHTHGDMVQDYWVFQGAPSQVFDNVSHVEEALMSLWPGKPAVREVADSIERRQVMPNAARLVCSYKQASRSENICENGVCSLYYRKARCAIQASIRDIVHVLYIGQQNEGVGRLYAMHALVRIYFAGRPGIAVVDSDSGMTLHEVQELVRTHLDPLQNPKGVRATTNSYEFVPSVGKQVVL